MSRGRARAFRGATPRGRSRGALTAAGGGVSAMPPQLQRAYLTGKVAPRIRWRTPGQFDRCVAQARVHGMGGKAKGACARLYAKANGFWPRPRGRR